MPERVILVPRLSGVGGMVSFQGKLSAGLERRGYQVSYDLADLAASAVLVIGGTRHIMNLIRLKRRGVPIVQRLDGMNWLHRLSGRVGSWSLRYWLRAEYGNALLQLIRSKIASRVVYQSRFSQDWWERRRGTTRQPCSVVHNGVDLDVYTPDGEYTRPQDRCRLLLVEGSLQGGYEFGLELAVRLAAELAASRALPGDLPVELQVAGRVSAQLQQETEAEISKMNLVSRLLITWAGLVPADRIPALDRSAHVLFSADINPACPNSVIEALACGLPVVAYDTGALPELVTGDAGRLVPYGGDPWKLDAPDLPALTRAAAEILVNQDRFRAAARQRAEEAFNLDTMVDGYLEAMLGNT